MKSVLIMETTSAHWRNTENIALVFKNSNFNVDLYVNSTISNSLIPTINHHRNIKLFKANTFNLMRVLFIQNYDLIIFSSSILTFKYHSANFKRFFNLALKGLLIITFINYKSNKIKLLHSLFMAEQITMKPKSRSYLLNKLGIKVNLLFRKRVDGYNVFGDILMNDLKQKYDLHKPVFMAPSSLFRKDLLSNFNSKINRNRVIVIPGRIDSRRRDYSWIRLIDENLAKRIRIILLGRTRSEMDFAIISEFSEKGLMQPHFVNGDFINRDDFENTMLEADFLLFPMKINSNMKESDTRRDFGPFSDAIRYGKTIITPKSAIVDKQKSKSCLYYTDDLQLIEILNRIVNDKNYIKSLKQRGITNAESFLPEKSNYVNEVISKI
jgi:hypothetical protein